MEGETLTLCRKCFFSKVHSYIDKYDNKCLSFYPLTEYNSYQFYDSSALNKYQFSDNYINNVSELLSKSPSKCTKCNAGSPQFLWVNSESAFGTTRDLSGVLKNEKKWLCKKCYIAEFKEQIVKNDIYLREYQPPMKENGMMSSWEY